MSSYVSARTTMLARVTERVCATLGVSRDDVEAVREARRLLARTADPVRLVASLPARTCSALSALAPQQWSAVRPSSAFYAPDPERLAALTMGALDEASSAVARAMRRATAEAILDFAQSPQQDFDAVTVCTGGSRTVLDLRRGHEVLFVQIDDEGRVDREYQGLAGSECRLRDDALVAYLSRSGILLETEGEDRHEGRRDGVRLIAPAARRDPQCPARGALLVDRDGVSEIRGGALWDDGPGVARRARGTA